MPLIASGVFIDGEDRPYEFESSYYLSFQIKSALASLTHINSYCDIFEWDNRCQYYHFYTDHLLYSIGQIANRFIAKNSDTANDKKRKECNRINYQFTEAAFPILSDKRARNVNEHIDEYNNQIIANHRGVGGFNLIDDKTDTKLVDALRNRKITHPYTLDLLRNELLVRRRDEDLIIPLKDLHAELLALLGNVETIIQYLDLN